MLGKVKLANIPFRFSDCDVTPRTVAPLLGQHNREIAAKLGFSAADIDGDGEGRRPLCRGSGRAAGGRLPVVRERDSGSKAS